MDTLEYCENSDWKDGRRIVDLAVLSESLRHCKDPDCPSPLYLHNCTGEKRFGLGSDLYIPCNLCGRINTIALSLKHEGHGAKSWRWDVNKDCASGMLGARIGPEAVKCLFTSMNIADIDFVALRGDDREVEDDELEKEIKECNNTDRSGRLAGVWIGADGESQQQFRSAEVQFVDAADSSGLDLLSRIESDINQHTTLCEKPVSSDSEDGENDFEDMDDFEDTNMDDFNITTHAKVKSPTVDEKLHKCAICHKCFDSAMELSQHKKDHPVAKPYKCHMCNKSFQKPSRLNRHIKAHGKDKQNMCKCDVCGKSYSNTDCLAIHKRIHTGEKPYKCDSCDKRFRHVGHMDRHRTTCKGAKPYECVTCGASFSKANKLSKHKATHSGEKRFSCEVCGKFFNHAGDIPRHMKIHTGERPYICEICGLGFIRAYNLSLHMRTHTGERPHKCNVCAKCFKSVSRLTEHMRIHTGEKPHVCDFCGKCFSERGAMTRHRRIHTGEKPYKCDICGSCFNQSCSVKVHKQIHHQ